jgi:hypothetical protein
MSRFAIIDRIDAALATVAERKMDVRAIYLTTEDRDAFDRAMRACATLRSPTLTAQPPKDDADKAPWPRRT